jgi:hypothetical protein
MEFTRQTIMVRKHKPAELRGTKRPTWLLGRTGVDAIAKNIEEEDLLKQVNVSISQHLSWSTCGAL